MRRRPWTRIRGQWWRVIVPKWAHNPMSGKGAALYGGRFNAAGDVALYLSGDVATAVAEYQNMIMARPGTFCVFDVDVAGIVDAADDTVRRAWRIAAADLIADWRIAASRGREPRSWRLAKRLCAAGATGLRYPSLRRAGGVNLVLWRWNDGRRRNVAVIDTLSDLPRDQSAWPPQH